jgi:hypothetical protein
VHLVDPNLEQNQSLFQGGGTAVPTPDIRSILSYPTINSSRIKNSIMAGRKKELLQGLLKAQQRFAFMTASHSLLP